MASLLLGIDIGGTGAKAGLFHLDGRPAGSGYVEYRMITRLPGQSEHDAEAWWSAAGHAVRQAMGRIPASEIAAVGVGCTNGLVAVDECARPLRPAIMLWDQRALPQIEPGKLPRPLPSQAVAGYVNAEGAAATGLLAGTPVVAGCMDTLGAALGSGVVGPDEGFLIMGTAARFATALSAPRFDSRFMNCTHVLPGQWLTLGAMNGVGSSLRWVRDTFTIAADPEAVQVTLRTMRLIRDELGLNMVCGASNTSFGLPERAPLNAAYLCMAMVCGLTAAITDPTNPVIRQAVLASDVLLGHDAYAVAWIADYRSRQPSRVQP